MIDSMSEITSARYVTPIVLDSGIDKVRERDCSHLVPIGVFFLLSLESLKFGSSRSTLIHPLHSAIYDSTFK